MTLAIFSVACSSNFRLAASDSAVKFPCEQLICNHQAWTHLSEYVEHHVGELKHGVALDLGEGEDVVEVEHELVGRLGEGAEVLPFLGTHY